MISTTLCVTMCHRVTYFQGYKILLILLTWPQMISPQMISPRIVRLSSPTIYYLLILKNLFTKYFA